MRIQKNRIIRAIICLLFFSLIGMTFVNYCYKEKYTDEITTNSNWEQVYSDVIEQHFVSDYNTINSISFKVLTYERSNQGTLNVRLYDEKNESLIEEWSLNLSECKNNEYCRFSLKNPVKNAFAHPYKMEIEILGANIDNSICIPVQHAEEKLEDFATRNGQDDEQLYRLSYRIGSLPNKRNICIIVLIFILLYAGFLILEKRFCYKKLFMPLIVILGGMYVFLIPRMAVPDEPAHYQRAYEISTGHFLATHTEQGGYSVIPENLLDGNGDFVYGKQSVYTKQKTTFDEKLSDKEILYSNINQALYSPFAYAVQAIGLFSVRHITATSGIVFYGGRIAALLFSCILLTIAMKIVPFGKRSILLIASMPMFLQEMVSYSCDATINTLAIFFVAYIFYLRSENKEIKWYDYGILSGTCFMIAMSKIVYLPFVLLVWLIPNHKFQSKVKAYIVKCTIIVLSGLANLCWLAISASYMVETNPGVMPSEQVKYVLTHPIGYIGIAFQTIYESANRWLYEMVGSTLGWFQIAISLSVIFIFIIMIIFDFCISTNGEKALKINTIERIIIFGVVLIIIALTFTSLYVQWTPLRKASIDGIQGRYFIPLLFPIALILPKIKTQIQQSELIRVYVPIILEINMFVLLTIYSFFA